MEFKALRNLYQDKAPKLTWNSREVVLREHIMADGELKPSEGLLWSTCECVCFYLLTRCGRVHIQDSRVVLCWKRDGRIYGASNCLRPLIFLSSMCLLATKSVFLF